MYRSKAYKLSRVELSILEEIERVEDKAIAKKNSIASKIRALAEQLMDLNPDLNAAAQKARKAADQAKELGADDLVKLFNNRADSAKDFADHFLREGNKIYKVVVDL